MSTLQPSATADLPQHVAIIMDGNRRWARQRGLPKAIGHASGAKRVRSLVEACSDRGIRFITLFAFSTENWKRPADEVSSLMGLFLLYLQKEASDMHAKGVRLKVIGDISGFDARLQKLMTNVQAMTAGNQKITLTIAANYGGRWDMLQAVKAWLAAHPGEPVDAASDESLRSHLSTAYAPDPDLLIRTGGESRISNFMLWQMAYTELYFSDALWPDFTPEALDQALEWYAGRDRRFGASSSLVAAG
ncbi:MAG: polyprenyl diphosphate synthase [Rhodoferax sp.]|nr:polyprenyl diphosphate synthase [Rhodoferax sp.]